MNKLYTLILILSLPVTILAQNVGIGTPLPQSKLHILGNADILTLEGSDHAYIQYYPDGYAAGRQGYIGFPSSSSIDLTIANENGTGDIVFLPGANVGIGTSTPSEDLHIYRPDTDIATLYLTGTSQGSGMMYVGQSTSYGGGMVYDGDGTPTLIGDNDRITFFRRIAGTDYEVMSYPYSNNQVRIEYLGGSGSGLVITDNDGDMSPLAYSGSSSDVLTGSGSWADVNALVTVSDTDWIFSGTDMYSGVSGNVGIGTTVPGWKLDVVGDIDFNSNAIIAAGSGTNTDHIWYNDASAGGSGGTWHFVADASYKDNGNARIHAGHIYMDGSGQDSYIADDLGIGTTTPDSKLDVTGGDVYVQGAYYNRVHIVSDDYWAGIEIRTLETSTSGNPHIDFTHGSSSTNYGIRVYAPDNDNLEIDGGNVEVDDGYFTVGNPNVGSTTKTAFQEFSYSANMSTQGTTNTYTIGTFIRPPGATVTITKIDMWLGGYHQDGNEDHYVKVKVGSNKTGGLYQRGSNGYLDTDWNYIENVSWSGITSNQTVQVEVYDESCFICGSDYFVVQNVFVRVEYQYTLAPQTGDILATGRVYARSDESVGDLAEYFPMISDGNAVPGMIVSYVPGTDNGYHLSDTPYDNFMTGVISEDPSVVLNSPETGPPLALVGRVNVRIAPTERMIKGGDALTTSIYPGLAQIADKPGPIIGFAVRDQQPGEDFVEILVQPGRFYYPIEKDDQPGYDSERQELPADQNIRSSGQ